MALSIPDSRDRPQSAQALCDRFHRRREKPHRETPKPRLSGNNSLRKGIEAEEVAIGTGSGWLPSLGMRGGRIFYYDAKKIGGAARECRKNMPTLGSRGGPLDSEVFYDFGTPHDSKSTARSAILIVSVGGSLEIANSVFMQYIKQPDGSFTLLPKQNVDFGGGLERIAAASNKEPDIFQTDVFEDIIELLESSRRNHTTTAATRARSASSLTIVQKRRPSCSPTACGRCPTPSVAMYCGAP